MKNKRIIGELGDANSGGTLFVCFGGIHGNETGGVHALEQVFEKLSSENIKINGKFIGVRGNLKAIEAKKRYLKEDLNRLWHDDFMALAHTPAGADHPELQELAALCTLLDDLETEKYSQKVFLDLHGTSAEKGIFTIVKDYSKVAFLVDALYSPVVVNLLENLKNTTLSEMEKRGFLSLAFEGGKIGTKEVVENHKLIIWQILLKTALISPEQIPEKIFEYGYLKAFSEKLPKFLTPVHRHKINSGDDFRMIPGFQNYDPIQKGQLLATDKHGDICAQENGYLLMPLYQKEGTDGFFIVSPFSDCSFCLTDSF